MLPALLLMSAASHVDAAPPSIACNIRVPATVESGQPVPLTMVLRNRGTTELAVLDWGTPFEDGWFQPFVSVTRNGQPVPFAGAIVKRGEPEADEYFGLAPGKPRQATLDMALVFDFATPGRYVITPQVRLHDVAPVPVTIPRARAKHHPLALPCRAAVVVVRQHP